jgi:hypothetical protein
LYGITVYPLIFNTRHQGQRTPRAAFQNTGRFPAQEKQEPFFRFPRMRQNR